MNCPPRSAVRLARPVGATIALVVVALSAHGSGVISTNAATVLATGASPHAGAVVVEPCATGGTAPVVPDVATPSALGNPPAAPASIDSGSGTSALQYSGTTTAAGGTYDCTTFYVPKTGVLTFSGATTIRATTSVSVEGTVRTTADDAPLTILCGGDVNVGHVNGTNTPTLQTSGARSDLTIRCAGRFATYYTTRLPRVAATQSSIVLRAGSVWLNPDGLTSGLDVDLLASGAVDMQGVAYSPDYVPEAGVFLNAGRDAALRSSSGTVTMTGGETVVAGRLTVEAGVDVLVDNSAARFKAGGGIDVTAYGGRIQMIHGARITVGNAGAGVSTWRAKNDVLFTGHVENGSPVLGTAVTSGASTFVIESVEGNVEIGTSGSTSPAPTLDATGAVVIRAGAEAHVYEGGHVSATGGVSISATGAASIAPGAAVTSSAGGVVVESAASFSAGAGAQIVGTTVDLRAKGDVSLPSGSSAELTVGDLLVTARTALVTGAATARGKLRITSVDGLADVRNATLLTRDVASTSGAVEVFVYEGSTASIFAQGATLRSGAGATSGDVVLRIYAKGTTGGGGGGGGGDPGDPGTPGVTRVDPPYVMPSSVVVKLRRRSTDQDIAFKGFVDMGAGATVAAGAATLSIAGVDLPVELTVSRKGTAVARGTDVLVTLGLPRPGASRRPLNVRARGAFLPADLSGDVSITLALPGVTAECRVAVEDGRFDARHGRLVAPTIYVADVRALKRGLVRMTIAVPTESLDSALGPDVVLALGGLNWHVAANRLVADRHGVFAAKSPVPGLTRLSADPRTRTIAAEFVAADLGLPTDGGPVEIQLAVNSHTPRVLRIVLGRHGGRIVY